MTQRSWLKCINDCDQTYSVFDIAYYCKQCGGLLEVQHDLSILKEESAEAWKNEFVKRAGLNLYPYTSGVWAKKEWVLPEVGDEYLVSLGEGHTPLLPLESLSEDLDLGELWIKLSGNSHTGSFKDLGMTVLVSVVNQMIAQGKNIKAIAAASTGDTSAALAAYAASANIPAVILLPKGKISPAQLIQPVSNGALVLALDTDFDGCMKVVQELIADDEIYLANSLNSLRIEGQKTVGFELVQQLGWEVPDWIVIPAGNLGNVSALGQGFKMMQALGIIDRFPRIACAQAANANPLYLSFQSGFEKYKPVEAKPSLASAIQIGAPVSYPRAVKILREFNGVVGQATEAELAEAAAWGDRAGLYTCPQTGVALAVLKHLRHEGTIREGERVVLISTAHGLKFTNFKVDYHFKNTKDTSKKFINQVVEIQPRVDLVKKAIQEQI